MATFSPLPSGILIQNVQAKQTFMTSRYGSYRSCHRNPATPESYEGQGPRKRQNNPLVTNEISSRPQQELWEGLQKINC